MARRFEEHFTAFAARRAPARVGSKMPMSSAIIPMTTRSSTSVKPGLGRRHRGRMRYSFRKANGCREKRKRELGAVSRAGLIAETTTRNGRARNHFLFIHRLIGDRREVKQQTTKNWSRKERKERKKKMAFS